MNNSDQRPINGRYLLNKIIGQGGMGRVYQAHDRLTDQEIALKHVSHPPQNLQFFSQANQANPHLALAKEFQILASLRHPHIISVLDFGFDVFDGETRQPFFTMDLLENAQTIVQVASNKPLPLRIQLIFQMLQALVYLHRQGILHRDLKPENVLVNPNGTLLVKIVDFGIALSPGYFTTNLESGRIGTLAYLAPEQLRGGVASPESDLYAAGLIAYEILLETFPYNRATTTYLIHDILNKIPDTEPMSVPLSKVLNKLLAKQPYLRFASAHDVIGALASATGITRPQETTSIRESFLQFATFVGREAEMDQLKDALKAVIEEKRGSAWLLGGESGVGKSRLLREMRTLSLVEGAFVLVDHAVSEGGLPGQLWRQILRRLLLEVDLSDVDAANLRGFIPDIERLLGRQIPVHPPPNDFSVFLAIRHLFEHFARQGRPILLILEDLQWGRNDSLQLLGWLIQEIQRLPLLIIGSYRDDEAPDLHVRLPGVQVLKLGRLNDVQIAKLSSAMIGQMGEQPALVQFLTHYTEGNAFILVEVIRALAENAGNLENVQANSLPETLLPEGVKTITQRRLRRVPAEAYELLKIAAVAGRQLDLILLQKLAPSIDIAEWVMACASILEIQEGQWRFAHDKLREAILHELTPSEVSDFNRQVALGIEAIYPDNMDYGVLLAEFWSRAGDADKELSIVTKIIQHAWKRANFPEIVRYAERGLSLLQHLTLPDQNARTAALLFWKGRGLVNLYQFDEASRMLNESLSLYQALEDERGSLYVYIAFATASIFQEKEVEALAIIEQAMTLARALDDSEALSIILTIVGTLCESRGQYDRATAYLEEQLSNDAQRGDEDWAGWAWQTLGRIYLALGRDTEALDALQKSLAIGRKNSNLIMAFNALLNLCFHSIGQLDIEAAQLFIAEAETINQDLRANLYKSYLFTARGILAEVLQQSAEAHDYFQQAMIFAQSEGTMIGLVNCKIQAGLFAHAKGRYAEARQLYQEALQFLRSADRFPMIAATLCYLSRTWLAEAHVEEAAGLLEEALSLAVRMKVPPLVNEILLTFAELYRQQDRLKEAALIIGSISDQKLPHPYAHGLLVNIQQYLRIRLSPYEFTEFIEQGAALTADDLIALVS